MVTKEFCNNEVMTCTTYKIAPLQRQLVVIDAKVQRVFIIVVVVVVLLLVSLLGGQDAIKALIALLKMV
ncbi:hypothetical protein [Candidatus Magnetobacterium casense]|uniref:Transmembrane protein n=1 Tax=Candidatus Magnetobacterium casense TaxID=1455061 RepID=A0ABS6S253_9BACT|nr:hypothetical protein [Candidatus Magnetobacterium casensis]MBV6342685.1 hypothetical protein [Candidatus Magnetobacterium casensis]